MRSSEISPAVSSGPCIRRGEEASSHRLMLGQQSVRDRDEHIGWRLLNGWRSSSMFVRVRDMKRRPYLSGSVKCAQRLLQRTGGMKSRTKPRLALRLSLPEREEISRGLLADDSCRVIATRERRSPASG